VFAAVWVTHAAQRKTANAIFTIDTPMDPPEWARLERQLLDAQTPAIAEYYHKYYDSRGYVQCVLRWGQTTALTMLSKTWRAGPNSMRWVEATKSCG
jgi:hypothetical protein